MPNFFATDFSIVPPDVTIPSKVTGLWEYYFNLAALFTSSELHFHYSKIHTEFVIREISYKLSLTTYEPTSQYGYNINTVIIRDPSIMSDYTQGNDSLQTYVLGGDIDNEIPNIRGTVDPQKYYSNIPWTGTKTTPRFPYLFVKVDNSTVTADASLGLHIELVVSVSYRGSRTDLSPVTTSVYY